MATNTTNYGLVKPAGTEKYDIAVQNGNMDKIDAQMKKNADDIAKKTDDTTVNAHKQDTTVHVTQAEKNGWNGKLDKSGGTMTGKLIAQSNAEYGTAQVRNITLSTAEPTAAQGQNGDLWGVYE